jgi:hypothetical protein
MRPAPDAGAAASSLGHHAELGDLEGACGWDQDAVTAMLRIMDASGNDQAWVRLAEPFVQLTSSPA